MKQFIQHCTMLFALLTVSSSFALSGDGMMITKIIVVKFPTEKNGKKIDKDDMPDLYFKFYKDDKVIGKSEVKDNCKKNNPYTFSGKDMPFRIEQNESYYLELLDHDKDGAVRNNKDEVISKRIPISWQIVLRNGKKTGFLLKDETNGVEFTIMVEHLDGVSAAGEKAYIKFIKPIDQELVPPKKKVLEGCGPVAAAMIMGYWHTEHGYKIMHPNDNFNGTKHPWKTIEDFRDKADTKAWGDQEQSATRKMKMEDALAHFAKKANEASPGKPKLKVDMMWSIRRWEERNDKIKSELKQGSPLILLLKKMPPCLKGKWVNATKVFGDHYIVVNGFDDRKKVFYVMPGWREADKSTTSGPEAHQSQNLSHCQCSYAEIKESDPSLIWIKR